MVYKQSSNFCCCFSAKRFVQPCRWICLVREISIVFLKEVLHCFSETSSWNCLSVIVKSQMNDDAGYLPTNTSVNNTASIIGQGTLEFNDLESTLSREIPLSKDGKQIGIATLEIKVDPPTPVFPSTSILIFQSTLDSKAEDKTLTAKVYSILYFLMLKKKAITRKGSSNLSPSKDQSFRRLFSLPETETMLIGLEFYFLAYNADYSCSLFSDFLHHGRIFISRSFLCFYSNIFGIRIAVLEFIEPNNLLGNNSILTSHFYRTKRYFSRKSRHCYYYQLKW